MSVRGARGIGLDPRLGEAERHGDRDEPLLRAVVEVALDPPALGVGGGDDALARVAQVIHADAQRARAPLLGGLAGEEHLAHPVSLSSPADRNVPT